MRLAVISEADFPKRGDLITAKSQFTCHHTVGRRHCQKHTLLDKPIKIEPETPGTLCSLTFEKGRSDQGTEDQWHAMCEFKGKQAGEYGCIGIASGPNWEDLIQVMFRRPSRRR